MSVSLPKRRGAVVMLLVCLALGLVFALALAIMTQVPLLNAVLLVLPATLVYAIGTGFSAFYLCRAYPLHGRPPLTIIGVMTVAALFAGLLWATFLQFSNSVSLLFDVPCLGLPLSQTVLAAFFCLGVLLYCLAVAVHYLLHEFVRARTAEQRELQAQLMAQQAQLRMLRTQIDPHFLFNSLNSISALTTVNPAGAREMTVQLASFFRLSLGLDAHRHITVGQELQLIRHFLAIEQVRFGERLQVEEDIDAAALDCLLPPMLIQPLVENAVKHGVCGMLDGGCITLRIGRAGSLLQITLHNLLEIGQPEQRGNGMGLDNVRQRLASAYGHEASVHWLRETDHFEVSISMPAQTGQTEQG
ncbi:sensor histidine kinase [Janthinobacterium aquaticum]|uniref:sensor histidine kinase n=1 Tax=Janthinobacterium sp. FT58W TaxID=2654254 RepID=UPI0012654FA7|nr:histidine kinase [Janthinobacterium sp. FT58W]KAB8042663.1 sensor histidine kinase [Janthinobacterium sp. FT58W]